MSRSSSGRYWRAVAYDTFTGQRWLNTTTVAQAIDGGNHVRTPQFQARREITQTFTILAPTGNVLFAAGQPLRVSLKATADLLVVEQEPDVNLPLAEITLLHRRDAALQARATGIWRSHRSPRRLWKTCKRQAQTTPPG